MWCTLDVMSVQRKLRTNIKFGLTNKEAEDMAKKYQMKKDEFLKAYGNLEMIKYDLEIRKVIDKLKEYNK